ncbi:MAG: adenylyl-sulfate kinase [Gammaproteobacteria bacterium]|nr:adenylyl-sulfate kinase [Gammaproteobacteria bacterium]
MNQKSAITWWLTGLPGAGKTTLAQALATALRERGEPVCVIDGDELRAGLCKDLGFDETSRAENVRRAAHLAQVLNANAIHAVVAMVSPSMPARAAAYATIGISRCKEIYVCTPLEVCEKRDPKGLYARARSNQLSQMTGVQAGYEPPFSPVLRIDTSQAEIEAAVQQLLQA